MNCIRGQARGIILRNRKVLESQVSIMWNCDLGRIMNKKGGDILCDHDARFVSEQLVSYVGDNIDTKGEGQREPFSCSLRRGGPIGKVLVHRWSPKCYQQ